MIAFQVVRYEPKAFPHRLADREPPELGVKVYDASGIAPEALPEVLARIDRKAGRCLLVASWSGQRQTKVSVTCR